MTFLADTPEIGAPSRREISARTGRALTAGIVVRFGGAPYPGRARGRAALTMAAVVASHHNPVIKAFYEKLTQAGKVKKIALVACM